jgi:uncharacterized protein (DUF305 family)
MPFPQSLPTRSVPVRGLAGALAVAVWAAAGCVPGGAGSAPSAPFDQVFIDMMVPHHEGAVEMARIAQERGEHAEIEQLADTIIRAQNEEIGRMKQWRKAWFGSDETPPMSRMPMVPGAAMRGHGSGGTMDMAADVEKLRTAAPPFDRAFIDAMIPHHESAIDAARAAETRAQRQEIKELAKAIIADQQREIEQMRRWRQAWYG